MTGCPVSRKYPMGWCDVPLTPGEVWGMVLLIRALLLLNLSNRIFLNLINRTHALGHMLYLLIVMLHVVEHEQHKLDMLQHISNHSYISLSLFPLLKLYNKTKKKNAACHLTEKP